MPSLGVGEFLVIGVIAMGSVLPLVGVLAVVWYLRKIANQLEAREPTMKAGHAEPRESEPR